MMDIETYIKAIPKHRAQRFSNIVNMIKALYPEATESIQYKMPTYAHKGGWVAVANQKNYISVYTCSSNHIAEFKKKSTKIKTGKGCINFKDTDNIPLEHLKSVVHSAMKPPSVEKKG